MTIVNRGLADMASIAQQFLDVVARSRLARVRRAFSPPFASNEIKIFAKIRHVFVGDRVSSAVATLMGNPRIVADAIEADLEVATAVMASLSAAR